jgi:prephenate dehydrogenase
MKSIIELAREAGFHKWYTQPKEHPDHVAIVARFAHLVRAEVLEEAAGVCEEVHDRYPTDIFPDGQSVDAQSAKMARITANNIAATIRALKEKT